MQAEDGGFGVSGMHRAQQGLWPGARGRQNMGMIAIEEVQVLHGGVGVTCTTRVQPEYCLPRKVMHLSLFVGMLAALCSWGGWGVRRTEMLSLETWV